MSKEVNDKATGSRLKTNMAMSVRITDDFSIEVSHKDGMCDLKALFEYGNELRKQRGKSEIELREWLGRQDTAEFIIAHEQLTYSNSNVGNIPVLKGKRYQVVGPISCLKIGKGRYAKIRSDLLLTIKAAAVLDKHLEVLIYTIFINQRILDLRDKGGDNFKRLNDAIDQYMPGREGKTSNKGLYINAAKKIRAGLGCESLADWNVQEAGAPIHEQRSQVEDRLVVLLENGMVEGTKHLWALIEKQCKLVQNS